MPMVTPNINLARPEVEQVISSFRVQFDLIIHSDAGCNLAYKELVHFRAWDVMLARIETKTPQRGTSEELEWRAGEDGQSEWDVDAPKYSTSADTKIAFWGVKWCNGVNLLTLGGDFEGNDWADYGCFQD